MKTKNKEIFKKKIIKIIKLIKTKKKILQQLMNKKKVRNIS